MNFYEYLGVKQTASAEEIRKAFRTMAKTTHPDYNPKDNAFWEMVELNIIRDTLLIPEKRRKYDESLKLGTSDNYYPPQSTTQKKTKTKHTIYKSVRSLFIYRCKVCGHEMLSTWKGYCLLHYLEATNQLENEDFIFTYEGQLYRWADPPTDLHNRKEDQKKSTSRPMKITRVHIILYFALIVLIFGTILGFMLFTFK